MNRFVGLALSGRREAISLNEYVVLLKSSLEAVATIH